MPFYYYRKFCLPPDVEAIINGFECITWYKCNLRNWRMPSLERRFGQIGVMAAAFFGSCAVFGIMLYLGYNGWRF